MIREDNKDPKDKKKCKPCLSRIWVASVTLKPLSRTNSVVEPELAWEVIARKSHQLALGGGKRVFWVADLGFSFRNSASIISEVLCCLGDMYQDLPGRNSFVG